LGQALAANSTLEVLCLKGNKVSDNGATGLARGLTHNQCLTDLDLQGRACDSPRIGERGARELYRALQVNLTVKSINLAANRVAVQGMSTIQREFPKVDETRMQIRKIRKVTAINTASPARKRFLFF